MEVQRMTYETIMAVIEKTAKVKLKDVQGVVEELYYNVNSEDDSIDYFYKLNDLIELVLKQKLFEGDENDYHNLSVTYAREGDYYSACRYLEKGIQHFPYAVDLLADYLSYGMQCDKIEECVEMYERLLKVRNRWNWRAYQFSIDYLMKLLSVSPSANIDDIETIVNEFVEKMPEREESYISKAEFIETFRNKKLSDESFVSVLEYATSEECIVQRTPKCDLRLSEYYYDLGQNLERANELIERCKINSIELQLSVNRNYVYLLSSLCKMSLFYRTAEKGVKKTIEGTEREKMVLDIFDDYHIAAINRHDSRVRGCKDLIIAFVRETGIPYPYDDGIVNDI